MQPEAAAAGAGHGTVSDMARSAGAAGLELARVERWSEAATALERALQQLPTAPGGPSEALLLRAEWTATLVSCRLETGVLDGCEAQAMRARAELVAGLTTPLSATSRATAAAAALDLALARTQGKAGRLADARRTLEEALAILADLPLPLQQARTQFQLAGVLALGGELPAALELWQRAADRLAVGELQQQVQLRGRIAMNRGIALADLGRHREAASAMREALVLFEGLVQSGRVAARAEQARALRNLGFVLARSGRHADSVPVLARAAEESSRVLRQAGHSRSRQDVQAWRTTRGGTLNSLGYTLFAVGRLTEAEQVLRRAARDLSPGAGSAAAPADELARVWCNQAHVAAHRGRLTAAHRLYARARAHFAQRAAGGQPAASADRVNADLGLARVATRQGRATEAATWFGPAMTELAALTRQGQLQHERTWLAAWQAQRDAWWAVRTGVSRSAQARRSALLRDEQSDQRIADMLVAALATPPQHAAGLGPEALLAVAEAAGVRIPTALPPPSAKVAVAPTRHHSATERVATAYLGYLLGWMAELLTESEPNWIHDHANEVDAAVAALCDNAAQRTHAAPQLAQWFLATRGLRAQRSALADGGAPELAELRTLLQQLHRIEQDILGEQQVPSADQGPSDLRHAAAHLAAHAAAAAPGRHQAWQALKARARSTREELVARGLLPPSQRLAVPQALDGLTPGQALMLLARPDAAQLLLITLQRRSDGAAEVRHAWAALGESVAPFPCSTLHTLARSAWAGVKGGAGGAGGEADPLPEADSFALAVFQDLWNSAVRPTLSELRGVGITAVDLVPSGDLHLVPWNHLADLEPAETAPRMRLFPSVGAWWRCRAEPAGSSLRPARWALTAAASESTQRLRWVEVERQLSRQLWGKQMREASTLHLGTVDFEADALLGMGHGTAPDANPARVGLLVDEAAGSVLLPHHLLALRHCRCVLLSACLLGHTDGSRGEALGFLSGCFDHQLFFAAGWLTEVPDQAACLYSLAAQWALRQQTARRACGPGMWRDWSEVLARMRRCLLQGVWPEGFSEALGPAWTSITSTPLPAAPPPRLLRALPWAVTLG